MRQNNSAPGVTTTFCMATESAEKVRSICKATGSSVRSFVNRAIEAELARIARKVNTTKGA